MSYERTDYERLVDLVLLLSIWSRTQARAPKAEYAGDRLKLMKMAFLVGHELHQGHIKALSTPFYRDKFGPYSKEVSSSWDALKQLGYLEGDEIFAVTDKGKALAAEFTSDVLALPVNEAVAKVIDNVIAEYAHLSTSSILKRVYEMKAPTTVDPRAETTIAKIPLYRDFAIVVEDESAQAVLDLPASWETTLAIAFDAEAIGSMNRCMEDARNGRVYSGWEALTAGV